jgi:Tfp pilus assembly protein PilF
MNGTVSIVSALIFLISVTLTFPATAEDSLEYATKPNKGLNSVQHKQLDVLFAALKNSKSEAEANSHEQEIWRIWTDPANKTLSDLMDTAFAQIESKSFIASIKTLDSVVEQFPKYAEGWNQRAIMHFQLKNFDKSLEDIEKALKLEPRHFGAYSGRGMIHFSRGDNKLATKDILKAMRYHPFVKSRNLLLSIPVETEEKPNFI